MGFDVKAWLKDLGFSDEEQTALLPQFSTTDRTTALEEGQLRQTDYSRQMDASNVELATERTRLEEADAKLNRELSEWATVQGASAEKVTAAAARITTLEQQVLTGRQRVEQIATAQGLDPKPYLEGLETTPPDPAAAAPPGGTGAPAVEPPDLSGLVKTTDAREFNQFMFEMQTTLPMLQAEHLALTGEPLDTVALGAEIQRRAKSGETPNPRETWEALHDIPARRTAAADTKHAADITAAEERGRQAQASEAALPTGSPVGKRAIIFQPPPNADGTPGEARTSELERPQPRSRMEGALQAIATGKYRPAPEGASPGTRSAAGSA